MSHHPYPSQRRALRQVWRRHRRDGVLPGRLGAIVQEHAVFAHHPDLRALDEHLDHLYLESRDEQ